MHPAMMARKAFKVYKGRKVFRDRKVRKAPRGRLGLARRMAAKPMSFVAKTKLPSLRGSPRRQSRAVIAQLTC